MPAADLIRAELETALDLTVDGIRPVAGGDINDAYRVDTSAGRLFVKTRPDAVPGTYRQEAAGLMWLAGEDAVALPEIRLVHDPTDDEPEPAIRFLALEWIDAAPPTTQSDERLGRGLAHLHVAMVESFGETPVLRRSGRLARSKVGEPSRFGPVVLPNREVLGFAEFYATQRLVPLADRSHELGHLSAEHHALMHRLAGRMDQLIAGDPWPSRTHGDLWAGNVLVDTVGRPFLIDPAAHASHREVDLAALRVFGGPSERCFDAYREISPLADGWRERIPLMQLGMILLHVALFGGGYEAQAVAIARRYV